MFYHLFFVSALLSCCTGDSSVHDPPKEVLAFAGGYVILPCTFNTNARGDLPTVEWSKIDQDPKIIFLYRDGCETHEMKDPAFKYRTSLTTTTLQKGNISLRLSNVQVSDAGRYQCMWLWKNSHREVTFVDLIVDTVSEPTLSVVSAAGGIVTVQCEVNCSRHKLHIMFIDDQGNHINSGDTKRDQSPCTLRQRVTLENATNRVTCRVQHTDLKETRENGIFIPADYLKIRCLIIGIVVCLGGSLGFMCGLVGFLMKKHVDRSKQPMFRQGSGESAASDERVLLNRSEPNEPINVANSIIEELQRRVNNLTSKLCERDETIHKLQHSLRAQLSPVQHNQPATFCAPSKHSLCVPEPSDNKQETSIHIIDHCPNVTGSTNSNAPQSAKSGQIKGPGIQRQNSTPTPGHHVQVTCRRNSSPNIFPVVSSCSNATKKKLGSIGRSQSVSYADPDPIDAKLQSKPLSALSSNTINHYRVLVDVCEELCQS